jgi:hypothetical protein
MDCERSQTAIAEWAHGGLASAELRAHVCECPSCRLRLVAERQLARAIDRGLDALLVYPQGEFAARVRERIARTAAQPHGSTIQWLPSVAATLGVIALGGITYMATPRAGGPRSRPTEKSGLFPHPVLPPPPRPPIRAVGNTGALSGLPQARRQPRPSEVLLPPGQAAALLSFSESLWGRRGHAASLLKTTPDGETDLPEPADLTVAPLEVKPVVVRPLEAEVESGDGVSN